MEKITLHIKNMVCPSCITVISNELYDLDIEFEIEKLGEITVFNPDPVKKEAIKQGLEKHGFEIIKDKETLVIEQIKLAVIDLIDSNAGTTLRNSDYIAQQVGTSYYTLSKLFSKHEHITIEKYIIHQKIEKVKEFLDYEDMNLSGIASKLGYSSVHHLSSQFKAVTGVSVNRYKKAE
ncbi:MAG: AraC family transcriptional regulator [Anditalea sp.]